VIPYQIKAAKIFRTHTATCQQKQAANLSSLGYPVQLSWALRISEPLILLDVVKTDTIITALFFPALW
jgi:hypothetical protein